MKHHFGAETCSCLLSFIRFKLIWPSLLSLNSSLYHWGAGQSNKCWISCSYMEFQVLGLPFSNRWIITNSVFCISWFVIVALLDVVFCIMSSVVSVGIHDLVQCLAWFDPQSETSLVYCIHFTDQFIVHLFLICIWLNSNLIIDCLLIDVVSNLRGMNVRRIIFSFEASATSLQFPWALLSSVFKVGCGMFATQLINGRWTCLVIGRSWGSWHSSLKFIALPARSRPCQIHMTWHCMTLTWFNHHLKHGQK